MILKRKLPKAYRAFEKDSDYATIVFAESASQAKTIALSCESCEDAQYIDIRVQRMPGADELYTGFSEIDWYDSKIRIALVRDFGWACLEPSWECDTCPAKQYCRWHEEGGLTMYEKIVRSRTLPEAYHRALITLLECGVDVECPDWNTTQREIALTMVVNQPLHEPMISRCFIGGYKELEQYRQEMLDGILDFEVERGNWAYTYHQRMEKQIPFVIEELKRNPYSRRAVIDIRDQADIGSAEPACLQHIQYFVRNDRLDCAVLFRSNDACKATFMNAFALIMLQKRIADELGYKMGTYTHRANSFHCYEKDLPLLAGYAQRILKRENLTFDYIGEWEYLMDEAKSEIAQMVLELKGRGDNAGR